ncbi:MAG: hypothetical protein DRP87_03885 [Spirochaetes bacterium]|nr:MAG: hypothetical protein DRP87_03885 [Spirochaetota bacterium]
MKKIELLGLKLPEVNTGDDPVKLILDASGNQAGGISDDDVLVITSKILSKALGYTIEIEKLIPSKQARRIAEVTGAKPRFIQAILDNSEEVLFAIPVYKLASRAESLDKAARDPEKALAALKNTSCELITLRDGLFSANAGLDSSNHPAGIASVPPSKPDELARRIRKEIEDRTGHRIAVIITDTEWISPTGTLDCARGSSGIQVNSRKLGEADLYGKPKYGGLDSIVDEIAGASALLMGQTSEGIPVVILRGLEYKRSEEGVADYFQFKSKGARRIVREVIKTSRKALGLRWLLRLVF